MKRKTLLILCWVIWLSPGLCYSDESAEKLWDDLIKREPFIYSIPRVNKTTPIDGVYVKTALRKGESIPCRRCPDWFSNPGIWRLYFNKGIYRVINTHTGWKSIGTYVVNDDKVMLTNDPVCMYELGVYSFKIEDHHLKFQVVNDPCKIKLRGLNLSETEWISCQTPNEEAAITEHWPKPDGCR